ncbi:MAG: Ig-like domain-containing protein [Candidatus Kapaibacteriota bacterium]
MKTPSSIVHPGLVLLSLVLLISGCGDRMVDGLSAPSYPQRGQVFIDDFESDLIYAAFGGSDVKAFQVDYETTYNNSRASMRYEVPDANSPQGAYAGGAYFSRAGRDLSGFNALTFYIKATQPATIDVIGFGNDFGTSSFQVALNALPVNTNWKKVVIPIPDPARLNGERGLFFYSTGPFNEKGYTFWVDDVQFEHVSDLGTCIGAMFNGEDRKVPTTEKGASIRIEGLQATADLPNGTMLTISASPSYFNFVSSDTSVATVSPQGVVQVLDSGNATITAWLGAAMARGSLELSASGTALIPTTPAPTPTLDAKNVISLYSNAYTNVPVDTWNTRWQYSTTESAFIKVGNDDVIRYYNLNFVGVEFSSSPIDATSMTHFHIDVWTPDPTPNPENVKVMLVDFGANGVYGGGDDVSHEITITAPTLQSNGWVSLDIPLASFSGLTTRAHLAQLVLSGTVSNLFVDNVYLYKTQTSPTTPAPTPAYPAGDVISVFSDAYQNVGGTNFSPNWGQSTVVSQVSIGGNATLLYTGLNYQGIELGSRQNVSSYGFLHLDYNSANATALQVFLISPGPVETAYTLPVPTGTGWRSVDIPLSAFAPVALTNVIQLKFVGNGNVYLDNILFRK